MEDLIPQIVNFSILLALLSWKLIGPFKAFVAQRSESIGAEIRNTSEQLRTAQAQLTEFGAKLTAVDHEIQMMRQEAKSEASRSHERIVNEAKRLSDQVVREANARKNSLVAEMRSRLAAELAEKVILRSEALLRGRLTGDDRVRLRKEFSNQLESLQ